MDGVRRRICQVPVTESFEDQSSALCMRRAEQGSRACFPAAVPHHHPRPEVPHVLLAEGHTSLGRGIDAYNTLPEVATNPVVPLK